MERQLIHEVVLNTCKGGLAELITPNDLVQIHHLSFKGSFNGAIRAIHVLYQLSFWILYGYHTNSTHTINHYFGQGNSILIFI